MSGVRWRMDVNNEQGKWKQPVAGKQLTASEKKRHPKATVARNALVATIAKGSKRKSSTQPIDSTLKRKRRDEKDSIGGGNASKSKKQTTDNPDLWWEQDSNPTIHPLSADVILTGKTIHHFFAGIVSQHNTVKMFPFELYNQWKDDAGVIENWARTTNIASLSLTPQNQMWVLPVQDSNHYWHLVCVCHPGDWNGCQLMIFDSNNLEPQHTAGVHLSVATFACSLINTMWMLHVGGVRDFQSVLKSVKVSVPQKRHNDDSGVYCILNLVNLINNIGRILSNTESLDLDFNGWYEQHETSWYKNELATSISLLPGTYIVGDVLEKYSNSLVLNCGDVVLLHPLFYHCWANSYTTQAGKNGHLQAWAEGQSEQGRLEDSSLWLVPIHQDSHWQLLCFVNPRRQYCQVLMLDSYYQLPPNVSDLAVFARSLLSNTKTFIQDADLVTDCVTIKIVPSPRQQNGVDCGVFCYLNMKEVITRKEELLYICSDELRSCNLDLSTSYTQCDATQQRHAIHQHHFQSKVMQILSNDFGN